MVHVPPVAQHSIGLAHTKSESDFQGSITKVLFTLASKHAAAAVHSDLQY